MALIRISEDEKKVLETLPEGTYEVYVDKYDTPEEVNGFEASTIVLKVRDDIESDFKNRLIWVNINTNPNIAWKLSKIAVGAGIPAGTDFEDLNGYLEAIAGASMKVTVKHRTYNGKTYVDVKEFYPTSYAPYVSEETRSETLDMII